MKQLNRTTNHNVVAWILLLMTATALWVHPTTVIPYHSTIFTNQLESLKLSSKSQRLNSQVNQLQESAWITPSHSVVSLPNMSREGVEPNITSTVGAFDGYNLFVLAEQNRVNPKPFGKQNRSLMVTNMEGELIRGNEAISFPHGTWVANCAKFINVTTIVFLTKRGTTLWNIYDNTTAYLGFWGHHDFEYNPLNNTIFTFWYYITEINGKPYSFDIILEYDLTGQLVWSLDTGSFLSHTQWCPFRDMIEGAREIAHSNSLFFDPDEEALYYHARNLNTFYKIDHKTGLVLWGLGEYGDFTLFDRHGNQRHNLFYHAHAVEKVDEDTFILFDNDYHNQTNPNNHRSRLLEITINETTMTAYESWVWVAPPDYYSSAYGDADRLPNGNRLGTFGDGYHPASNIGARLVEVNATGHIVWEMNFPRTEKFLYCVYRLERFRLTPILSSPPDIQALSTDDVLVSWQTWYNFRTNRRMRGTYTLYLDGKPIKHGPHVFDKFWRPTNLTFTLGRLEAGDYNLTLVLADDAGHLTTDSVLIRSVHIYREGLQTIELGQKEALLHWKGDTPNPLMATITRNNTQIASFMWNGSVITLDLNSFEPGTYYVTLHLINYTESFYKDRFLATIYPAAAPSIFSAPKNQSLVWNASLVLSWKLFDHTPAFWRIFVNDTLTTSETWGTQSYHLYWNVPALNEGRYNVTLVVYDRADHQTSQTMWLTVVSPSPSVIATVPQHNEIQWGQKKVSLCWEVHGGTRWTLWKNGTAAYSGAVTSPRIEVLIENWQRDWRPGMYNLTLQVIDEDSTAATHTSWIRVWVNLGDAYADSIVLGFSMWYLAGENALGPPDGAFTRLYAGYGNGHVTLDMGMDEEILNEKGVDFMVYARKGSYVVFVGNNISAPLFVGNQTLPPLTLLGEGFGNKSFDLASIGLAKARYIQIVYIAGEEVELDAVMAVYFNHPLRPKLYSDRWQSPLVGVILALSAILVVIRIRKRK